MDGVMDGRREGGMRGMNGRMRGWRKRGVIER